MYATRQQVESRVPHELVVQALDDNRDGEIDPAVEVAWHATVDASIDSAISQRYNVPVAPIPPLLANAGLILRCFALYQRRGTAPDANPFSSEAKEIRAKLDRVGKGIDPLTPDTPKARPVGTIISEPSRLTHIREGDGPELDHATRMLN